MHLSFVVSNGMDYGRFRLKQCAVNHPDCAQLVQHRARPASASGVARARSRARARGGTGADEGAY
eukprot:COSAG02_NODE_51442_length_314_cov_0.716279_1_plen_64_part_10